LAALLLYFLLPHSKTRIATNEHKTDKKQVRVASAFDDKPFMIFIGFLIIFDICFFQSFSTLPVFYKQEWKLTEIMIGYVLAFNGLLIAFVEMPFVKYAESRVQPLNCIVAGTLIMASSFIVLNLLPPSVFSAFVSISLFTVGEIVAMPFMNTYWTSRSHDGNRGEYASIYTTAFAMAHVAGPYSGAQLAQYRGFGMLWWVTGIVCVGAAAGFSYLKKKRT
jgi:predicted MFS family arabinose efflux permease